LLSVMTYFFPWNFYISQIIRFLDFVHHLMFQKTK
jgi:hypothetical protein